MLNKTLFLEIDKPNYVPIYTVQYDYNSRFYEITILNNSQPLDLTGIRVIVAGKKPDGKEVFNSCKVLDAKKGLIQLELTEQMNAVNGASEYALELFSADGMLSSQPFKLIVTRSTISKSVESSKELGALKDALNEVQDIDNRFAQTNAQLSDFVNERRNKYYVGKNHPYKTINEAFDEWKSAGYPESVIYIMNGEYLESISIPQGLTISFIGETKDGVIWRTTSGLYEDAPLWARGGKILAENITFVADHTSNPNFNYDGHSANQNAYAVHFDGGVGGKYVLRNCDLISYQDAALGCGTVDNTTIRLENCNLYSYTDTVEDYPNAELSLGHGGLLYHTYKGDGTNTIENLELINVNIFSKNSANPFKYLNYSTTVSRKNLLAINVNISGNKVSGREDLIYQNVSCVGYGNKPFFDLNPQSNGNNIDMLNYKFENDAVEFTSDSIALNPENGRSVEITSINDVTKCGYYHCRYDMPTTEYYFINAIVFGNYKWLDAVSFNGNYHYVKLCNNGVWGEWLKISDSEEKIIKLIQSMVSVSTNGRGVAADNIDDISISGYYLSTNTASNTPQPNKFYGINATVLSSTSQIQIAYDLNDNTKMYKRLKNITWSDWQQINIVGTIG